MLSLFVWLGVLSIKSKNCVNNENQFDNLGRKRNYCFVCYTFIVIPNEKILFNGMKLI